MLAIAPGAAVSAAENSGYPQQILCDRYRLERMVDRGHTASVWIAHDLRVGDCVVVKLLSESYLNDTETRHRFQREVETTTGLRSRFVARFFDYGVTANSVPFLVMELLHGLTLDKYARRVGRMPMRHAVRFGVQLSCGIAHAHKRGIVHRNLTPTNMFLHNNLSASADDMILKIFGFGAAKVHDAAADSGRRIAIMANAFEGAPSFAAPELLQGHGNIDHRADLYSIGMIVFWLLAGRSAFANVARVHLTATVVESPASLTTLVPKLPPALNEWFQRACARDPNERFQQAKDMAKDLHRAAGFEGSLDVHLEPGHPPMMSEPVIPDLELVSDVPTQRWIPRAED